MDDPSGNQVVIGDLWALVPGNRGPHSDPHSIYFTAGVQDEAHGLFGKLTAAPAHHNSGATDLLI